MNYYISDQHYGHKNIIVLDKRPFDSVEQMEETLTNNWNSVVNNEDIVYILGDFCWGKEEEWLRILDNLKGGKVLIRGNHDLKQFSNKLKNKFLDIKDYKEIVDNGKRVIMCHYPILFYKHDGDKNVYHLFGHVHNTHENYRIEQFRQDLEEESIARLAAGINNSSCHKCQFYNVGAMLPYMDYTPKTLEQIVEGFQGWRDNFYPVEK